MRAHNMVRLRDGILVDRPVGQVMWACGMVRIAHVEEVLGAGAWDGVVGCPLLDGSCTAPQEWPQECHPPCLNMPSNAIK